MRLWRARLPDDNSWLVNGSLRQALERRRMIWPWPTMSIVLCWLTIVSRRPSVMKLAWRRKTGAESSELPGRVVHGAMIASSSIAKGKSARRSASIVGAEVSCLRSLTTRRGIFSNGLIFEMPLSEPSRTTSPASHGKLTDNRSRPPLNVSRIAESKELSAKEKQKHI